MSRWFRFQVVTLVSAVVLILTGALASAVLAEDPADEILLRAEASRQQKTAVAEEFIAGLDLTVAQARQVLGLLDEAATVYLETYEQEAGGLTEMIDAFAEFARQDSLNQGFSPVVERRTARVNRQAKEIREACAERLIDLEKQAAALLGEAQLEFATSFKPGKKGRSAVGNRPAKGRKAAARGDRKRAGRRRRGAARRGIGNDGVTPRIAGRGRLVVAREELAGINRRLHPRLGPIGRFLLHPTAVEPLCDITATRPNQNLRDAVDVFEYGTRGCPASVYDVGKAEVADLRAEINNWNLINGLHLSGRQIEEIVEIYDAAEARVKGLDRPAEGRTRSMLVGRRAKGERIKPRVVRAAVERAVEQILNPGQRQVLVDYKACLIPPKNLKNPVRVGQASDHAPLERWLGRARKTPAGRRQKLIDTLLEKEAERFGELNPVERQQRVGLLLETVRGAAEMTETEFELDKAELAERIAPRDRVGELKREIGVLSRQEGLPGKVAQFMLKPGFIEQLRRRDLQLAVGVVAERANLAGGPRAENCAKGCAVKPKGKKGRRRAS